MRAIRSTTRGRRAGRPARPVLDDADVLDTATALLAAHGLEALTMRALARRLRVDPMTLYARFDDKDALVAAAVTHAYARWRPRIPAGPWRARVVALGVAYARFLAASGLLRAAVAHAPGAPGAVDAFARRVDDAVARAHLRNGRTACHALVDLVHGWAIAPGAPIGGLRAELALLVAGMR